MKTILLLLIGLLVSLQQNATATTNVFLNFNVQPGHVYYIQTNIVTTNYSLSRFWQDVETISNGVSIKNANTVGSISRSMPTTGRAGFFRVQDVVGPWFEYGWTKQALPTLQKWDIGTNQVSYVENDQPYEWYVDQGNAPDCGPASATMACLWNNRNCGASVADARSVYPEASGNGWWWTYDVYNYLTLKGASVTYGYGTLANITNLLTQGNILIFCLNMAYIPEDTNIQSHAHGYCTYYGAAGHFIVAKGFRITDNGVLWVECYDPQYSQYADGSGPKGRDREYRSDELMAAINNWWAYLIDIAPPKTGVAHPNLVTMNQVQTLIPPQAARGR